MTFVRNASNAFCLAVLISASAAAADLHQWKHVQSVRIDRTGLVKISAPLESLSASREGLEDLRFFDPGGREVPYLLQHSAGPKKRVRSPKHLQVALVPEATIVTLETGSSETISAVTLETPSSDFIKAVQVEGSRDGSSWETLARGEPVFRQPDGASRLQIPISPGAWAMLRLKLDDRRSSPIPVVGVKMQVERGTDDSSAPLDIKIARRIEEPGRTRLFLNMGGKNLLLAGLTVKTEEPLFIRPVALSGRKFAESAIRDSILCRGSIYRVAVEGRPATENLTFAVDVPVQSRTLVLSIQNGDNPPLNISAVSAQRRPVYLIFFAEQIGKYFFLTGNPRCGPPRYDLTDLGSSLEGAEFAPTDPDPLSDNPAYRRGEFLKNIRAVGPPLDVSDWKYRKRVRIAQGGIQQVELDLEVLAHASDNLCDLRLIHEGEGKHIPYILKRTSERKHFSPSTVNTVDAKRSGASLWAVKLPYVSLPVTKITCTTASPYFKREVRLFEKRPDMRGNLHKFLLASSVWFRTSIKMDVPLTLTLSEAPVTNELFIEIQDGDNQPLDLSGFQAWCSAPSILFLSEPDSDVFLYYGNTRAHAPRYDLALLGAKLLAEEKAEGILGDEEKLKSGSKGYLAQAPTGMVLWSVLALVVAGLLFVLAKFLPKPDNH